MCRRLRHWQRCLLLPLHLFSMVGRSSLSPTLTSEISSHTTCSLSTFTPGTALFLGVFVDFPFAFTKTFSPVASKTTCVTGPAGRGTLSSPFGGSCYHWAVAFSSRQKVTELRDLKALLCLDQFLTRYLTLPIMVYGIGVNGHWQSAWLDDLINAYRERSTICSTSPSKIHVKAKLGWLNATHSLD